MRYIPTIRHENDPIWYKLANIPWLLLFFITLQCCIGFMMMYSAASGSIYPWAFRQVIHFAAFFPIMLTIAVLPIQFWFRYAYLFYLAALLLLIIVEVAGHTAMGATRWLNFGPLKLQPSELMKLSLVLALARYFHSLPFESLPKPLALIPPVLLILMPFALILKQPDLGTAMILAMLGGGLFFMAGIRIWKFALVLGIILASMPIAWQFLHTYQKNRIFTFLDPEKDPLGAGYNILQSKIAIGSGGFWGKGLLHGSQSQLHFLPEHQTDFMFTMLTEELGFVGGTLVIGLFACIICYGFMIALSSRNHFGRLLASGIIILFFLHVCINIAMVIGLVPVVGVPLPLLSYGGTMMVTMLTSFGLLLNVYVHRFITFGRTGSSV
ncbi:MAG: rod shape-determining protein RodA [Burkholderiales bacterium]